MVVDCRIYTIRVGMVQTFLDMFQNNTLCKPGVQKVMSVPIDISKITLDTISRNVKSRWRRRRSRRPNRPLSTCPTRRPP